MALACFDHNFHTIMVPLTLRDTRTVMVTLPEESVMEFCCDTTGIAVNPVCPSNKDCDTIQKVCELYKYHRLALLTIKDGELVSFQVNSELLGERKRNLLDRCYISNAKSFMSLSKSIIPASDGKLVESEPYVGIGAATYIQPTSFNQRQLESAMKAYKTYLEKEADENKKPAENALPERALPKANPYTALNQPTIPTNQIASVTRREEVETGCVVM